MRKWNIMLLALALLLMPVPGHAQELPELFAAAYSGAEEGLQAGMRRAIAGMEQELTLHIVPESARIEEGKAVTLNVTAGNPRPQDTMVTIELKLPQRLTAKPDAMWQVMLPAAQMDEETGELVPSVSTFTREIYLTPGGGSELAQIGCEMSMGTRFYRAQTQIALCVADISAAASVTEAREEGLYPGDLFTYELEIVNEGTAPKDVQVDLVLPQGVSLTQPLPLGFLMQSGVITGHVRAEAAMTDEAGTSPSSAVISLPVQISEDALEGDEDAVRLLSGALRVDGERVPLPRVQVCSALISAQMVTDTISLKAGEETELRVVLVNSGLAPADVHLSCMLPKGLVLAEDEEEETDKPEQAAVLPPQDGAASTQAAGDETEEDTEAAAPVQESRTLIYDVHMPAAVQTKGGVTAATQVIRMNVKAESPQENLSEQLVGAALAWSVDDGETKLGEAIAMRLSKPAFLGVSAEDWNSIFWASVLLLVTVCCLCAAVRSDRKEEDFCCE